MFRARRVMRRRAVARSAVIGGTVYHAAKRRTHAGQGEQMPEVRNEAPPAGSAPDLVDQITELAELREQGILNEDEFVAEKKRLLGL